MKKIFCDKCKKDTTACFNRVRVEVLVDSSSRLLENRDFCKSCLNSLLEKIKEGLNK